MKNTPSKSSHNGNKKHGNVKSENRQEDTDKALRDLFVDELKDIYWAEKELTKAIQKLIKHATSEELSDALTDHLEVTKEHVTRLEEVFSKLGENAQAKKCEAMAGLLKEGNEIIEETEEGVVRDAGIILAAQKVEHYEIATYGTLRAFANTLGENEVASLLEETLNEEKEADETLSEIAESSINVEAVGEEH